MRLLVEAGNERVGATALDRLLRDLQVEKG
jgi:hypothetical protein